MEQASELDRPLRGKRILVADDEFLIAVLLEETLIGAGAEIVSAATLAVALRSAKAELLSAAVLDVRLIQETTEAVADILTARGVPFLFYSGQALPERIRERHPGAKVLMKPTRLHEIIQALVELTSH
ncbi:MAG: response regulator [Alphaproteobacteria bacterium]|nr:response regulator [Alphaproteobacteria bacterium]